MHATRALWKALYNEEAVNDLDEAISHLQAQHVDLPWGVEYASALSEAPDSRWVQFLDPAGNLIEFVQFHRDSSIEQDP